MSFKINKILFSCIIYMFYPIYQKATTSTVEPLSSIHPRGQYYTNINCGWVRLYTYNVIDANMKSRIIEQYLWKPFPCWLRWHKLSNFHKILPSPCVCISVSEHVHHFLFLKYNSNDAYILHLHVESMTLYTPI